MNKNITYVFTDGSEITIDNQQRATITGSTKKFAFSIWTTVRSKTEDKRFWTAYFVKVCNELHKKHGIVLEYTDHFTGVRVNHFENLMNKAN